MSNKLIRLSLLLVAAMLLIACAEQEEAATSQSMSVVQGMITPGDDVILEREYALKISLLDVSRADTMAEVLAMQQLWGNSRWPVAYKLEYFSDQVKAGHRYVVQVRLEDAVGQLLAITDTQHDVDLYGASTAIERDVSISSTSSRK
jgi:uncharacterized lipoprotein YbaY